MKSKKIIATVLVGIAVFILAAAICIYASFNGSIIKRMVTTKAVKDYVSEQYAGEPYEVEFCRYDFKFGYYFCIVQSKESEDTRFTVYSGKNGFTDDFDSAVTGRQNTLFRLENAIDDYADELLKKIYPHRAMLILCSVSESVTADDIKKLNLDMPFDVKEFPLPVTLTVWTETTGEKPTWEEIAERFCELELITRNEIPALESYSICLQSKYIEEDGELKDSDFNSQICANNVPREVITDGNLKEYLASVKAEQEREIEAIENGEQLK